MRLRLPKFLIEMTGDIHVSKYPCFIAYKPQHHKVKGSEVREILDKIEPGDILLRRFDGYLNTILTPGFWGHAAVYTSDNIVIHSVKEGVIQEDILEFSRCDSLAMLRYTGKDYAFTVNTALYLAYNFNIQKFQYDYDFLRGNNKVYCTELVDSCYNGLFKDRYENHLGNNVLTPDGIFGSSKVEKVLVIKH